MEAPELPEIVCTFLSKVGKYQSTFSVVSGGVMRFLHLLLISLLSAIPTVAQTDTTATQAAPAISQTSILLSEAPGISITQINWRKDIYIPALYEDPMKPNQEQADLLREQKAVRKMNAVRIQEGQSPLPIPTREILSTRKGAPPRPSVTYLYEVRLKNTAQKSIRALIWEYRVYDLETQSEVGRHRFSDSSKIRPGKTANLMAYSATPAVSVVAVPKSGKEWRAHYSERVVVSRIEYDDGTFWQRPVSEP
jgi:hypothetical protein